METPAPHIPGDTTPTAAAPGSSAVKGISAAKLGGCLLTISLVEKYSFWGDFKHKHTHTERKPAVTGLEAVKCEQNQQPSGLQ